MAAGVYTLSPAPWPAPGVAPRSRPRGAYRIFVRLKDTRFDLCAPVRRLRSALHVDQDESGRDRATEGQAVKREGEKERVLCGAM